jgi:hypothetical protein
MTLIKEMPNVRWNWFTIDNPKRTFLDEIKNLDGSQVLAFKRILPSIKGYVYPYGMKHVTKDMETGIFSEEEMLMIEIRDFDRATLKPVTIVEPSNFMYRLKNSIEIEIVENRLKHTGYDNGFSYTDIEYDLAYNAIFSRKWYTGLNFVINNNRALIITSGLIALTSHNAVMQGIFLGSLFNYFSMAVSIPNRFC